MSREMKDNGVEWSGEMPKEWRKCKTKNIIGILTDYTANGSFGDLAKNVQYLDEENFARVVRLTDLRVNFKNKGVYVNEYAYRFLKKSSLFGGEILIANVGAYAGLMCEMPQTDFVATLGPNMMLIKVKENLILSHYLFLLSKSPHFEEQLKMKSISSAQPKLNKDDVRDIKFALPSLKEQLEISDYLDERVFEIDNIITQTTLSIEEYKKYKYALITKCITKGKDTSVAMKSSNVDWIGEMPESWDYKKLKYIFSIKKEIAGREGFDILSVTQSGLKIKNISKNDGQISADYSKYQMVSKGDFVMNHMDLLTGWVDCSIYDGVTSPDYRVFKFQTPEEYSARYYTYIMQICYKNRIFYGLGQGVSNIGRWRLQTDKFINFMLPVPSKDEQQQIANYLDKKCSEIDTLITQKQQLLTELESYKKSLIYECVTGKREIV